MCPCVYNFTEAKAHTIYTEASGHIGVMPMSETTKLLVVLAALKRELQSLASQLPEYPVVMGMYGVGPALGPQLMAEIGDVRRTPRKYWWLTPALMPHRTILEMSLAGTSP